MLNIYVEFTGVEHYTNECLAFVLFYKTTQPSSPHKKDATQCDANGCGKLHPPAVLRTEMTQKADLSAIYDRPFFSTGF
jgi:hypothetical protein